MNADNLHHGLFECRSIGALARARVAALADGTPVVDCLVPSLVNRNDRITAEPEPSLLAVDLKPLAPLARYPSVADGRVNPKIERWAL